ncbi:MAG: diguanylate cyclase [Chloroflexaceae bacterium]
MNPYKVWLDNLFDAAYVVDRDRVIIYWNKSAEELTGYSKEEVLGTSCSDDILRHVDFYGVDLCQNSCPLHKTICDGRKREAVVFLHHKQGHRVPVHIRIAPIRNQNGEIIAAIEIFSNYSKNLHMIKELKRHKKESTSDPLLYIGNRRYAEIMFHARQLESKVTGNLFGVIFFDIDKFKEINDTYGHSMGDKVLLMVARTVVNLLGTFDIFARWGGDEFIIYLPNIHTSEGLRLVVERIKNFVRSTFLTLDGKKLSVTLSLGATLVNSEDTIERMLERVDALMYASKSKGGNECTIG